jgi:hypothetical protein
METRLDRAKEIVRLGKIRRVGPERFEAVGSNGEIYTVCPRVNYCSCPDNRERLVTCKHLLAAELIVGTERRATARRKKSESLRGVVPLKTVLAGLDRMHD